MSNSLPSKKKLISISEAAKFLGVSIDTVRRWDKSGVLHSERPDGKNRFFSLEELRQHQLNQPFSISDTAKKLNISPTTLRRLEARGILKPGRNNAGERVYDKQTLEKFLHSDYIQRKKNHQPDDSQANKSKVFNPDPIKLDQIKQYATGIIESDPTSESDKPFSRMNLTVLRRLPELIATIVIFFLLVAIGITNIKVSAASVLSATKTYTPTPSPSGLLLDQTNLQPCCGDEWFKENFPQGLGPELPIRSSSESSQLKDLIKDQQYAISQSLEDADSVEPAFNADYNSGDVADKNPSGAVTPKIISIKISDKAQTVNIHQFPTDNSEPIGKAKNGDTFELVTADSEWYMVKLPGGTFGFISAKFAREEEG